MHTHTHTLINLICVMTRRFVCIGLGHWTNMSWSWVCLVKEIRSTATGLESHRWDDLLHHKNFYIIKMKMEHIRCQNTFWFRPLFLKMAHAIRVVGFLLFASNAIFLRSFIEIWSQYVVSSMCSTSVKYLSILNSVFTLSKKFLFFFQIPFVLLSTFFSFRFLFWCS